MRIYTRTFDISSLDPSLRRFLEFNPSLVARRKYYILNKVLSFMKEELGVETISDLLRCDVKQLILALQAWINKRVHEITVKTIRYEVYLARAFFSFHEIEIPSKK
jgi:hypothetical protein